MTSTLEAGGGVGHSSGGPAATRGGSDILLEVRKFSSDILYENIGMLTRANRILGVETRVDNLVFDYLSGKPIELDGRHNTFSDDLFDEYIWRPNGPPSIAKSSGFIAYIVYQVLVAAESLPHHTEGLIVGRRGALNVFQSLSTKGGFSHDGRLHKGVTGLKVVNIGAMACQVLCTEDGAYKRASDGVLRSQLPSGHFPYVWSPSLFRIASRLIGRNLSLRLLRDRSPYFFDMAHHCYILLALLKTYLATRDENIFNGILRGISVVKQSFKRGSIFAHETNSYSPRYCNFGDNTAFFLWLRICCLARSEGLGVDDADIVNAMECIRGLNLDLRYEWVPINSESKSFGAVLPAIWMDPKYPLLQLKLLLADLR